jgi:hypothetical protein
VALVKPAERSSTAVHRWRECFKFEGLPVPDIYQTLSRGHFCRWAVEMGDLSRGSLPPTSAGVFLGAPKHRNVLALRRAPRRVALRA